MDSLELDLNMDLFCSDELYLGNVKIPCHWQHRSLLITSVSINAKTFCSQYLWRTDTSQLCVFWCWTRIISNTDTRPTHSYTKLCIIILNYVIFLIINGVTCSVSVPVSVLHLRNCFFSIILPNSEFIINYTNI